MGRADGLGTGEYICGNYGLGWHFLRIPKNPVVKDLLKSADLDSHSGGPMRFNLISLIIAVGCSIACKKAEPTSSKKEGTAEQPTEVSGGFGLTMQCTVTNKNVPNSTSSEIACIVSNDDGTKFTGKYQDLKGSVTTRNSSDKVKIVPSQATGDSPVSIVVSLPGVKPDDAVSIQVEGKFDGTPATLSSSLLGPFALTCSRDVTYWVVPGTPDPANLTCSEAKPCTSIGQAVSLIPDIINCNLTIKVKGGTYQEALMIASREIRPNKTILIKGVDGTPIIKAPADLPNPSDDEISGRFTEKVRRTAVQISSILAKNAYIAFENIEIQGGAESERSVASTATSKAKTMYEVAQENKGKFETGIYASTSSLKLTNVKLTGFSDVALLLDQSSCLLVTSSDSRPALEINKSRVGLRAIDVDRVFFSKDTKIIGNGDIKDGAGLDFVRTINIRLFEDATLTIKDLAYGITLDKSLFNPAYATAGIDIENVFTGLHLVNYSEFIWEPELTKQSHLTIKKCYFVCIDVDNSIMRLSNEAVNPTESTKKRLILELDARLTEEDRDSANMREHYGLLRALNRSQIEIQFIKNKWCNLGNGFNRVGSGDEGSGYSKSFFSVKIASASNFIYSRYNGNQEAVPLDCQDSNGYLGQFVKNYDVIGEAITNAKPCPYGTSNLAPGSCYLGMGITQLSTLVPTQGNPRTNVALPPEYQFDMDF